MQNRRRGLLTRLAAGLRDLLTGGGSGQVPEPPPPSIPTEPPPPPEEVYLPPPPPGPSGPDVTSDVYQEDESKPIQYVGQHFTAYTSRSRTGTGYQGNMKVLPRWKVGGYGQHVNLRDVKALLDEIGYKQRYVILVTGVPEYEYPGKEGEHVITLSFPLYGKDVWDSLDYQEQQYDPDSDEEYGSSEGWINYLLQGYEISGADYQWADIQSIDILDQPYG